MDFSTVFKIAVNDTKQIISRAIGNDVAFSCQLVNISLPNGDDTVYPTNEQLYEWMKKLFSEALVPKPLNEKAIAQMKAKNIVASKPSRDLLLVVISTTETHVHVGISMPNSMKEHNINEFVENVIGERKFNAETIIDSVGKYILVNFSCEFPFKERDVILQNAFNELKRRKIYVDDEEDDPVYDF